MAQQIGNHLLHFIHKKDPACRQMAERLSAFHQDAMRRSDTYHSMVHAAAQLGNINIDICEQLPHRSVRVTRTFDPESKAYPTTIEISRNAVEAQARHGFNMDRSKTVRALANSFLIDGIRQAFRFNMPESPLKTSWDSEAEDDMDELVLQGERNDTISPWDGGPVALEGPSIRTIIRICEEIRDHHVLLR
jgi:hypothetical protein